MVKKKFSLKSKMIRLMIGGWLLPVIMLIALFAFYLVTQHYQNVSSNLMEQIAYNVELCMERIDNCIDASRQATYDSTISNAYREYHKKSDSNVGYYDFRKQIYNYLRMNYQRNDYFEHTVFILYDDPVKCSYVYNVEAGGSHRSIQEFLNTDKENVMAFAEGLDTRIGFYDCDGRFYMVRNMKNAQFQTIGVLVMRLDMQYIFGNFYNMPWSTALTLYFDAQTMVFEGGLIDEMAINHQTALKGSGYVSGGGDMYIYYVSGRKDYDLKVIMQVDRVAMMNPFLGYPYVVLIMLIVILPFSVLFMRIYHTHVTRPMARLEYMAQQIENGNYGYTMESHAKSKEFFYLEETFNSMSLELKRQFDHIYEEEIAIRDARIMALQSHINPHFINNTLEMINWEARMNGDEKVSKMIEALGTLMDAAIDRRKHSVICLSEEMVYVNAYLYIISERLGDRLKIMIDMPEAIMDILVPRLILQPLIENAIEHGIIPRHEGIVRICGFTEDDYLYLDIYNDGTLNAQDKLHIQNLLNNEFDAGQEHSASVGIANVNQRLKIICGPECGLTMETTDEGHVRARLKIKIGRNEQIEMDKSCQRS